MITKELLIEIEKSKAILIKYITYVVSESEKIKDVVISGKKVIGDEQVMTLSYLKICQAWVKQKEVKTLEEAYAFMNKIQGAIEKVYYVNAYLERVKIALPKQQQ